MPDSFGDNIKWVVIVIFIVYVNIFDVSCDGLQ